MVGEAVVVAVIGATGTVLAGLFQAMRRENKDDHAMVSNALNRIETKLDDHIQDHVRGDV